MYRERYLRMPRSLSKRSLEQPPVVPSTKPLEVPVVLSEEHAPLGPSLIPEALAEVEVIKQQLGLHTSQLSATAEKVFHSFAHQLKLLMPSEGASSFAKALVLAGMHVFATDAGAHDQARAHHHARSQHVAHARVSESTPVVAERAPSQELVASDFERIGISSHDLAELVRDSFPPLVNEHGGVASIRFTMQDHVLSGEYFHIRNKHRAGHWQEAAYYAPSTIAGEGGDIVLRAHAFRNITGGPIENFPLAMSILVHEIGHSLTMRVEDTRYFEARVRGEHIPFNGYTENFLHARHPDYVGMAKEYMAELLRFIYVHAPEGERSIRDRAIAELHQH